MSAVVPQPSMPARIVTSRLILRAAVAQDAQLHHQLWGERDPRVPAHRRLDEAGHPDVEELAQSLLARANAWRDLGVGLLTVQRRDQGDLIGYCGLIPRDGGDRDQPIADAEIAYELLAATHGQGYATEAARAIVEIATGQGRPRLWAGVRDWNAASFGVLRALGFVPSGLIDPDPVHGDSITWVRDLQPGH